MANERVSLQELLNLSISFPERGTVNFKAMYTLLHAILRQLDIRDITVDCPGKRSLELRSPELSLELKSPEVSLEETKRSLELKSPEVSLELKSPEVSLKERKRSLELRSPELSLKERSQEERSTAQAAAVHTEWVKTVEELSQRVEALEQAANLEQFVTWEAMRSALVTERGHVKKGLTGTTSASRTQPPDDSTAAKAQDAPSPWVVPHQETMDALRTISRLKLCCDGLEERLTALDRERDRDHQELLQLKKMPHNKESQDAYAELEQRLEEQLAMVKGLLSDRDKSSQQVSGVQKAILHLQSECEKLHTTTRSLHEDNLQKQTHMEELYKMTEELEQKKADKNMVETEIRADKSTLDSKVSRLQFDSVTEQLSNMFNELLTKVTDHEQDWNKVMEKLSSEMDCKLNRIELALVKQLEARWKSIQERMRKEGAPEQDDAAVFRKQLMEQFHCLSCDRPVLKHTPGPQVLTLPSFPGLQPRRSMRPYTVYKLDQVRQHYRKSEL